MSGDRGVVIVGAGQAGFQAAASLREGGYEAPIRLVGDEGRLPYQRPPLTKACLTDGLKIGDLHFEPDDFFARNHVDLITGDSAVEIDRASRRLELKSGTALPYDHLILATGARNRSMSCVSPTISGVFSLRTFDDMSAVRASLPHAERIVIVGAGFIGLELAAVAAREGRTVHVVEAVGRVMERAVSPMVSQVLRQRHAENGVQFSFNRRVSVIGWRDRKVTHVELDDGRLLPADMVIVAVGIEPNAELAAAAGLEVENGVRVDDYLLTRDKSVSAIGDCASFPSSRGGGCIRLECVQNAVDQGRYVARRLTGEEAAYDQVPLFWTDQPGCRLQIAGIGQRGDRMVTRGDCSTGRFSVFRFRNGQLTCVESVGSPADHMAARKLLARGLGPTPDQAADLGFDLRALAAGALQVA
jgi:3-phenylpropionate/trans-cinnamate dioxygenase ferredoxin reductase subunit